MIMTEGSRCFLSVRTDRPVLKDQLIDLARFVALIKIKPPVEMGQEIVHEILGTDAKLVSKGTLRD